MFRTRIRKILRDIWARKARTALVSASIFIGVFGVVSLISAGDLLVRQLREDIDEDVLPMIRYYLAADANADASMLVGDAALDPIRTPDPTRYPDLPQPTVVQGEAITPMSWRLPNQDKFQEAYIFSYSTPLQDVELTPMRLLATDNGRWPVAGQNELVIEFRVAEKYGLKVGDKVVVRILSEAGGVDADGTPNIPEEEWTVTGLVFHPYRGFAMGGIQVRQNQAFYAQFPDAQRISGIMGYSAINVRFENYALAEKHVEDFERVISEETAYTTFFVLKDDPAQNQIITTSQQFVAVISVLALVAVMVAGFLVTNVINTIIAEQRNQIGVMKSIGATRLDNVLIYGGMALSYGLIGLVPGVLLGIPVGYRLAVLIGEFTNAYIDTFHFSFVGIGLGVFMGLLVPIVASIWPVYNGTRVTILEAMTDLGISANYGGGPIARLIERLPLPINIRQAFANISMKKIRLALTVVTLTLAVTAFMGITALFMSINNTVDDLFELFAFEIQFIPSEEQDFEETRAFIMENMGDEVEDIFPGTFIAGRVDDYVDESFGFDQTFFIGYDIEESVFKPQIVEGRGLVDDSIANEVVLTQTLAEGLGKGVGDTITVRAAGKSETFEIVGIDGLLPFPYVYFTWQRLAIFIGHVDTMFNAPDMPIIAVQDIEGYQGGVPDAEHTYAITLRASEWDQVQSFLGDESAAEMPTVFVSEALAETLNGDDMLEIKTATATRHYHVGGTIPAAMINQANQMLPEAPPELATPDAQFFLIAADEIATLTGRPARIEEEIGNPLPNVYFIRLKGEDLTALEVDNIMADLKELLLSKGITGSYENQVNTSEEIAEGVLSLGVLFNATSVLMALVGGIGLLTTLSMSVFERQKEIGVMRSVGATSWTVATQFLVEGLLVGVIAWLVAVPLSILLANFLASIVPFGDVFQFSYPIVLLPIGLVGTLFIAAAASILPSIGAARKTVSDILRYQ